MSSNRSTLAPPITLAVAARAAEVLSEHQRTIWTRTDRLFAGLLACEWLASVLLAQMYAGRTWSGSSSAVHPHVWAAIILGGVLVSLPIYLALARPGTRATRQSIAVSQMLMSALLIHFGDGRVEMHFHIFGSFAFLAFYRDWRVLVTGICVITGDHLARGLISPDTIYGTSVASGWRTFEHAGWVIFENVFLIASCAQAVREMRGIALNHALLEASVDEFEQRVFDRTRELEDAQASLVRTARTAGMAEIATSVLHNVGNVLNSVNVSATVVADQLRHSELPTLAQVSDLIREHKPDLGTFLTNDERGKLIPDFIGDLSVCLAAEQRTLLTEIASLTKGIDHIKQIVASQQSMAKHTGVQRPIEPARLFDSALAMQAASLPTSVTIQRSYAKPDRRIELDEHLVLQILINLISNARQAVVSRGEAAKVITLTVAFRTDEANVEHVRFQVADNGAGIAQKNLTRIFGHGFTTKQDGHGFGLHGAANAARQMNGSLTAHSDGEGHGATFTLEMPVTQPNASASLPAMTTTTTQPAEAATCP